MTYHAKLIKGGKIVIPADLRREFGMRDGDTLVFESDGGALVIKTEAQVLKDIRATVKAGLTRPISVDAFLAEKYAEAASE